MIALLPLDDRPCNTRFPLEIGAIGGSSLTVPPRHLLGRFNAPGHPAALQTWLENLPAVETLIVSVDMLAYGGLVASRKTVTSHETALARLETLKKWRQTRPETPIYAFNILMRLAITMDSDAAVPHYYNVMRYARLVDEAARFPSPEIEAELREVEAQIPATILAQYRGARARNHAVNLQMLDFVADGTFDFLLITQEDCTEFGLHRREQDELTAHARELGVEGKFALHPGADEAALTLLAHRWNTGIRFQIEWSCEENKREIAVFEDVPYEDALHSHIEAMGGRVVSTGADADCVLFVNAPVGGSQKDESADSRAKREAQIEAFCERIAAKIEAKVPVALCDVAFPNGADDLLLSQLEKRELLGKLTAFSGWNTAGNTTGTVLAQCAALFRADDQSSAQELNRRFTFERLVDDWGYQARVRAELETEARRRGFSPLSMNGQAAGIEAIARLKLGAFARELAPQFGAHVEKLDVRLPWGRTFEVEVGAVLS
ncbi:MAG TPA: DUF4127 family protein [Abditibacterium sp.]|jgi:hypothetical protein